MFSCVYSLLHSVFISLRLFSFLHWFPGFSFKTSVKCLFIGGCWFTTKSEHGKPNRKLCENGMWWLVLIAILSESRTSREKDFWVCLWKNILIMVNGLWRLNSLVSPTIPWQVILSGWLSKGKLSIRFHSFISPSDWIWYIQLIHAAAKSPLLWQTLELGAKINPCSFKLFDSVMFYHRNKN